MAGTTKSLGDMAMGNERTRTASRREAKSMLTEALQSLASLKLTVFLFALSIFLVLVGTLAQDKIGIWEVMNDYFRSFLVWVPFRVFFPQAWFPDLQWIGGGFWFFGGRTIGLALGANLLAAHLIRFKVQSKGSRLWTGWLVFGLGVAVCALIISYGSLKDGVQDRPWLDWNVLWWSIVAGVVLLIAISGGYAWKSLDGQPIMRILSGIASLSLLLVIILLVSNGHRLNDSALRILWQLTQGTVGGLVLMAGSLMVFRKRAGMVVIHLGVGLLMFNELFVSVTNVEQQIFVREGEETSVVLDNRFIEMAIVDRSDVSVDQETLVPESLMREGATVKLDSLPFDVRVDRFMRNSNLLLISEATPADLQLVPQCTQGIGMQRIAVPAPPVAGAESGNRNDVGAVYATVLSKEGKELATVLLLQSDFFAPGIGVHPIEVDKKTWHFELRMPREVKPYSIQLLDVVRENYIGTEVPRHYGSTFRIRRPDDGTDMQGSIRMNEPLRYGGETFYQSGFHALPDGGEATTLLIVTNGGWMMPYVSCMLVAIGMLTHFSVTLGGRISKARRGNGARESFDDLPAPSSLGGDDEESAVVASSAKSNTKVEVASSQSHKSAVTEPWWPTLLGLALAAMMFIGSGMPRSKSEFDLKSAGQLPVTSGGRVMPLDSLARNELRQLQKRENVKDSQDNTVSPVQWFLEVAAETDAAKKYPVFRVYELEVLSSLGLERRSGYLYSYEELEKHRDTIFENAIAADEKRTNQEKLERVESAFMDLAAKLRDFETLSSLHATSELNSAETSDLQNLLALINQAAAVLNTKTPVPLVVPQPENSTRIWESLVVYRARQKVVEEARRRFPEATAPVEVNQLVMAILDSMKSDEQFRPLVIKMAQAISERSPGMPIERLGFQVQQQLASMTAGPIEELFPDGKIEAESNPAGDAMIAMITAYRNADVEGFNKTVKEYRSNVAQLTPEGTPVSRIVGEYWFQTVSPFYLLTVMYIAVFPFVPLAWIAPRSGARRAVFAVLLLTVILHAVGLLLRIWISGRPPITNLYSSALFIGWVMPLLFLVIERFTRIGVGNFLASTTGFLSLLIAYNLSLDSDTFSVMQAVLDTQFWLATHVLCITLGYGTTFVAGFLGIVYVFGGLLVPGFGKGYRKEFALLVYGMVCFSLLFSFVGTVLGGLWADDSWGRFWGWDPKENGALIIVIWNALVLHARWGGMVRERGVAVLAIGGNIVTAWSWFGTNQLGFGLHSYGFTSGVLQVLGLFVLSQILMIGIGLIPIRMWAAYRGESEAA